MKTHDADTLVTMAGNDIALLQCIVANNAIADEIFGFHTQQAAEKLLKAWLHLLGGNLDRTHDLRRLLIALHDLGADVGNYRELIPLNSFAVQFRYELLPLDEPPLDRADLLTSIEALYRHVQLLLADAVDGSR